MVLTDREIEAALNCQHLEIDPRPDATALSSTAIDLTLGNTIRTWKKGTTGVQTLIDPMAADYKVMPVIDDLTEAQTTPFELEPKGFVLAWTKEVVSLPTTSRLAARVEGKSSLARIGVGVHVTAPTIHAGFRGPIQLEVFNHGPRPVKLSEGMKICQLILEQTLGTPSSGYQGQFQNQTAD